MSYKNGNIVSSKNGIVFQTSDDSMMKCDFNKIGNVVEYQKEINMSKMFFQEMLSEVYPLKLRIKIKREWLADPVRSSASIYLKYEDVFKAAKERLESK